MAPLLDVVVAVVVLPRQYRGRIYGASHALIGPASGGGRLLPDPLVLGTARRGLRWREAAEPREEFAVPQQRIARLQDPVVLVGEIDEPGRNVLRLQRVEILQSLRRRDAVIELAVDHERRRFRLLHVMVRRLAHDARLVVPVEGAELLREEAIA